ncbi:hypothetical protein N5C65_03315 [Pseudomonas aeruginosa]|uniref:hypothetical protein n=1 Tax=Pseudomonas aeruginosa TaxID=287 RepID=UPI00244B234C|nr:hypothetical protein [Pseudomonas aeruginosa]MDH0906466.1 hypothetical protein [Pseudomonas aeruginosa]MDH1219607.1 hypothetical protein [Pseudomonas aeruginosa]MDH1224833.1 hypothetical protein [Pseudomonas aeruginosa]
MNDRELLELAARAAGNGCTWCEFWETMARPLNDGSGWDNRATWNPLKEDGDALRLAVTRGLVVTPDRENQRTLVSNQAGHEYCAIYWDKLGEMAATRLAITEAAAEIGKSMGGGE